MAEELDVVAIKKARPDLGLPAGARGTIVMMFDNEAYEVEFVNEDGTTQAMATFLVDEVEVVWRVADMHAARRRAAS